MVSTEEKLEEIEREKPIGCECINPHDQGVILMAIDDSIRIASRNISEIKSDYRKREMYGHILNKYINDTTNLKSTKEKVMKIPPCK